MSHPAYDSSRDAATGGIGIGAYGSLGGNLDLLPELGTALTLTVENRGDTR